MNRIVRENYPVASLPADLRDGLRDNAVARVTIEADVDDVDEPMNKPERVPTLDELFAMRRPPYKTTDQIVEEVRRMREDRDD